MNGSLVVLSILEEQRLVVSIATSGERYETEVHSSSKYTFLNLYYSTAPFPLTFSIASMRTYYNYN